MAPPVLALSQPTWMCGRPGLVEALDACFERDELEELLGAEATRVPPRLWDAALRGPVREFLTRPGKQLRARLVATAFELAGGHGTMPEELGLAVEALHAGSLVVDDIQDGATSRRGRPALHHLVGLPLALNAGNWMYFWASRLVDQSGLPEARRAWAQTELSRTMLRCHHGQALDLAARVDQIARPELPAVVAATTRLKTASLFELATRLGALAAGAAPDVVELLGRFGQHLGTALQMLDDLSSLSSSTRLDKAHEDLGQGRPTWPWAWLAEREGDEVFDALLAARAQLAEASPGQVMERTAALAEALRLRAGGHGRLCVRAILDGAVARLRERLGEDAAEAVRHDVERLEQSYA